MQTKTSQNSTISYFTDTTTSSAVRIPPWCTESCVDLMERSEVKRQDIARNTFSSLFNMLIPYRLGIMEGICLQPCITLQVYVIC